MTSQTGGGAPSTIPPDPQPSHAAEAGPDEGSRSVLVVDDEVSIRTVVRRALARDGWDVVEAVDGHAALELLRERDREWAAILLDLSLPGISGQQLFMTVRNERPDLVRRLAFTSGAAGEEVTAMRRPVLHKPFDIATLRTLARTLAAG